MPLSRVHKWFAVEDAKIAALTADPAGGTTTYDTLIDVPGIKEIGLSGDVETLSLRGDNTKLDQQSILTDLTIEVSHAKLSLDVLSILLGYDVTETGTTPAQTVTADLTAAGAALGAFYLEAKTPAGGVDVVGGDGHMIFWKCVLTSFPEIGFAEEDYRTVSFEAGVTPRLSDGRWHRIVVNETAAAITAPPVA